MMQAVRRKLLGSLWMGGIFPASLLMPQMAEAKDTALPAPESLRDVALVADARGEPLVLLASLPGCPFCELVRRNYLLPMRAEGLAACQFDVNDGKRVFLNFDSQKTTGTALAARMQIRLTPTVLIVDFQGAEIAPRLEGIAVPDFYNAYLDDAIAAGRLKLKSAHRRAAI